MYTIMYMYVCVCKHTVFTPSRKLELSATSVFARKAEATALPAGVPTERRTDECLEVQHSSPRAPNSPKWVLFIYFKAQSKYYLYVWSHGVVIAGPTSVQ